MKRFLTIFIAVGLTTILRLPVSAVNPGDAGAHALPPASALPQAQKSSITADDVVSYQPQASPREQGQIAPENQRARFERISVADGLSFPMVRAMLQDHRGFMWFATLSGLDRYDGYEFVIYRHDPGDPTSMRFDSVEAIYEDSDGVLWLGGAGGLDRFDRQTGAFTHVDTRGQVYCIYEDGAGTLWVGFWHGLYGYDRSTDTIKYTYQGGANPDDPEGLSSDSVSAVNGDQQGNLWIGTAAGLDRLNRETGTFTHYLGDQSISAIYEDRQGALWIGTGGGGLYRHVPAQSGAETVEGSLESFINFRHDPSDTYSLSDDRVTSVFEDGAGMLWVGTFSGLDQLDRIQSRFVHFQHDPDNPHSLSDDVVSSLFEDRSGVLWVGTANGVSKTNWRGDQFTHYRKRLDRVAGAADVSHPEILSESKVLTVVEDKAGILWIGTADGGLNRLDRESGDLSIFQHDPSDPTSLRSNTVFAVYEDRAGVIWVGTGNGWLEQFDPRTETFVHAWHLGEVSVNRISEDLANNLWIGTGGEGLYRLSRDRETLVQYVQYWQEPDHWRQHGSLSSHIVVTIYVDRSGVPWVGTYAGGINLWDSASDRFTHYRHRPDDPNSLSHEQVLSIFEDRTQNGEVVWIGTGGGGLNRFDRATETFRRYTEEDGLASDTVGCILADQEGFLWLGTSKGLSRFDPRTETFRNYDERDGVGVLSLGAVAPGRCLQSTTGEMFFSGIDGLYAFYPEQIQENLYRPLIAITALRIANQTVRRDVAAEEQIQLSYRENSLSFDFAALDFTIPEKNQYAYMMEGLDKDWVYAGTRRYVDYSALGPGDYVFRVQGSNNDGFWNEEGVAVRITIEPPLWDTWVFRGMVAMALVGLAAGAYRQRVNNIEARRRELEKQVEDRTAELSIANLRLEQEMIERERAEEALAQQAANAAIAAERNRLARELHDAVSQTLFSASLIAEALPSLWESEVEEGRQLLQDLRLMSRGALAEMRTLLLELRPAALVETELGDLLRQLGEAATGREGLPVRVTVEGECELPDDVHVTLYRIAQEGLNNVIKHARANRAVVSLHCMTLPGTETTCVELCVRDDGRGFDPGSATPDHLGLGIMRERAEVIGATFTLESKPGEGTRIIVEWKDDRCAGRTTTDQ